MGALIVYRTLSLEISSPDAELVRACMDEVDQAVKRITDKQLNRAEVRAVNQLYCTSLRNGPDRNNPMHHKEGA